MLIDWGDTIRPGNSNDQEKNYADEARLEKGSTQKVSAIGMTIQGTVGAT